MPPLDTLKPQSPEAQKGYIDLIISKQLPEGYKYFFNTPQEPAVKGLENTQRTLGDPTNTIHRYLYRARSEFYQHLYATYKELREHAQTTSSSPLTPQQLQEAWQNAVVISANATNQTRPLAARMFSPQTIQNIAAATTPPPTIPEAETNLTTSLQQALAAQKLSDAEAENVIVDIQNKLHNNPRDYTAEEIIRSTVAIHLAKPGVTNLKESIESVVEKTKDSAGVYRGVLNFNPEIKQKQLRSPDPFAFNGFNSPLIKRQGFVSSIGLQHSYSNLKKNSPEAPLHSLKLHQQGYDSKEMADLIDVIKKSKNPNAASLARLSQYHKDLLEFESLIESNPNLINPLTRFESGLNRGRRKLTPKFLKYHLPRLRNKLDHINNQVHGPIDLLYKPFIFIDDFTASINPIYQTRQFIDRKFNQIKQKVGQKIIEKGGQLLAKAGESAGKKVVGKVLTKLGIAIAGGAETGGIATLVMLLSLSKDLFDFLKNNMRWLADMFAFMGGVIAYGGIIGLGALGSSLAGMSGLAGGIATGLGLIGIKTGILNTALVGNIAGNISQFLSFLLTAPIQSTFIAITGVLLPLGTTAVMTWNFDTAKAEVLNISVREPQPRLNGLCWPTQGEVTDTPLGHRSRGVFEALWYLNRFAIDIAADVGTMVISPFPGTVVSAIESSHGYGNYIVIKTAYGEFLFGHLSELLVKKDDIIIKNQPIGRTGNTGNSSGPHLHYERKGPIDPYVPTPYSIGFIIDSTNQCDEEKTDVEI